MKKSQAIASQNAQSSSSEVHSTCDMKFDQGSEIKQLELEAAEQEERLNKYYDTQQDRRTMGVGFYQFSQDDETRQKQMDELKSIRNETLSSRNKMEQSRLKRKNEFEQRRLLLIEKRNQKRAKIANDDLDEDLNEILNSV